MPELELKKGEVVRLEGMLALRVKRGSVLISGGRRREGSKLVIPKAKSLPLEAATNATISYELGEGGAVEKLPGRTIPEQWDLFVEEVAKRKPKLITVIGDVDVGKTFFTTYVANSLIDRGIKVAALDGDVGQSDIGPPSTLGIGVFEKPVALLNEVPLRAAYFVGSMSPSGHTLEFLVGIHRLVKAGLKEADLVLVNTPGWISGGPGRSLQLAVHALLNPDLVVALQRERELEHLLRAMAPQQVRRMPVYKRVRTRSWAERRFLRWLSLGKYFEDARKVALDLRRVRVERCYYRTGEPLDPASLGEKVVYAERLPEGLLVVVRRELKPEELEGLKQKFEQVKVVVEGSERYLLVGLVDAEGDLLGIGVVEEIDYSRGKMVVLTPVRGRERIAAVQFGSMKINPQGEEVGTVKPGSF